MNVLQKKFFRLRNVSNDDIYRFEFGSHKKVMFIPVIGHLAPGACKDITSTLLIKEPLHIKNVRYLKIRDFPTNFIF